MGIIPNFRVGKTGVGEMGVGKMGVGEMGVGEMGILHLMWVYTVCLGPFYGTLSLSGLICDVMKNLLLLFSNAEKQFKYVYTM